MITLFTGAPGAGKTAALVHLLMTEYRGRPVFVDGLNGLLLAHTPIDCRSWSDFGPDRLPLVPDGSLVVCDEVQRVWRARSVGSSVPAAVADLETHRHRGLDFLLTTQAPALLDVNVRRLVGRHVHIRDTGILGRWWYEWPECSDTMNWRSCVNKKRWSLPSSAFTQHTSASQQVKPVRAFPPALFFFLASLFLLAVLIYFLVGRIGSHGVSASVSAPAGAASASVPAIVPVLDVGVHPGQLSSSSAPDVFLGFVPRLPGHPETAPAYDALRVVQVLPVVDGGACWRRSGVDACRCFVGVQVAPISADECRRLVHGGPLPFNPYVKVAAISPVETKGAPEAPSRGGP